MTAVLAITFWFLFLMLLYMKFREINPNHGVIPHGLGDLKIPSLPKKKVDTCQFCGRGIIPGLTLTNCPGCGAPITPLASDLPKVSPPPRPPRGTAYPSIASGMMIQVSAAFDSVYGPVNKVSEIYEYDELRGDNGVISTFIKQSERHVDPYLEQFVTAGILTPREAREMAAIPKSNHTYDDRLLGKEKR